MSDAEVFWNLVNEALPEASIRNFVLIAEIVKDDQGPRLVMVTSENMTTWLAEGMIQSVMDRLYEGDLGSEDD